MWELIYLWKSMRYNIAGFANNPAPKRFVKLTPYPGPMIEFYSNNEGDCSDILLPPLCFDGMGVGGEKEGDTCSGVLFTRCDNVHIPSLFAHQIIGVAVDFVSARQCDIGTISVDKCVPNKVDGVCVDEPVVRFRSQRGDQGDACNQICINNFKGRHCANSRYLDIIGGGNTGGLGQARDFKIGSMWLHPSWPRAIDELPDIIKQAYLNDFAPRPRTFIRQSNCSNIKMYDMRIKVDEVDGVKGDPAILELSGKVEDCEWHGLVRTRKGRKTFSSTANQTNIYNLDERMPK